AFSAFAFRDGVPCLVGHNVGFDIAFLERAGMPSGVDRLDTAELASILLPSASSYALQRLAAEAAITPDAAHRALDDAITAALVLAHLARVARALPPLVLSEIAAFAELMGSAPAEFFRDAANAVVKGAWTDEARTAFGRANDPRAPRAARGDSPALTVEGAFATDGPLAMSLKGYEDRPQQREL